MNDVKLKSDPVNSKGTGPDLKWIAIRTLVPMGTKLMGGCDKAELNNDASN